MCLPGGKGRLCFLIRRGKDVVEMEFALGREEGRLTSLSIVCKAPTFENSIRRHGPNSTYDASMPFHALRSQSHAVDAVPYRGVMSAPTEPSRPPLDFPEPVSESEPEPERWQSPLCARSVLRRRMRDGPIGEVSALGSRVRPSAGTHRVIEPRYQVQSPLARGRGRVRRGHKTAA